MVHFPDWDINIHVPHWDPRIDLPDWDLSEWSSVGTLAAVAFGLYVYAQDRRERRREQASLISAWFQAKTIDLEEGPRIRVTLYVSNLSEQPVYDIAVWSLRVLADPLN